MGAGPGARFGSAPEVEVEDRQSSARPKGAVSEEGVGASETVVWLKSVHAGLRCSDCGEPPGGSCGAGENCNAVGLILGSPSDGFGHAVVGGEEEYEVGSGRLAPGTQGRGPGWMKECIAGLGGGFGE